MTDNLKRPGVFRKSVYFFFTMSVHDFSFRMRKSGQCFGYHNCHKMFHCGDKLVIVNNTRNTYQYLKLCKRLGELLHFSL